MKEMRNKGATLQKIADEFNVSRERVRQIVGNSLGIRKKIAEGFVIDINKTKDENITLAQNILPSPIKKIITDKIRKTHHAISGGLAKVGEEAERVAHAKLQSLGFDCQLMPCHHPYDLLVNGKRVDVKIAKSKWSGGDRYKGTYWHFSTRKNVKDDADFFYCMADGKTWIIPSKELPNSHSIFIPAGDQVRSWKKSDRWNKYLNNFALLEEV